VERARGGRGQLQRELIKYWNKKKKKRICKLILDLKTYDREDMVGSVKANERHWVGRGENRSDLEEDKGLSASENGGRRGVHRKTDDIVLDGRGLLGGRSNESIKKPEKGLGARPSNQEKKFMETFV